MVSLVYLGITASSLKKEGILNFTLASLMLTAALKRTFPSPDMESGSKAMPEPPSLVVKSSIKVAYPLTRIDLLLACIFPPINNVLFPGKPPPLDISNPSTE
ncbi:hypothetical protein R80B4_02340 [Fibrobacteres bacterium R8-0-B4]